MNTIREPHVRLAVEKLGAQSLCILGLFIFECGSSPEQNTHPTA